MTNAHVVENQVFIELRRYGKARKYTAEVEGVGHECDLAILQVEDETFFQGVEPIRIGELPMLTDRVSVLGYPIGGDRISITEGIVSRIELSPYEQSQRNLLAVQIDAAINSGNSGGPVINQAGELVGVAFQAEEEGENIGYIIGSPVVRHFLEDMERATADGFPDLGVVTQPLESHAHRRALGLPEQRYGGVLVTGVVYGGSSWGTVRSGDVLLEVQGVRIAADGSVHFRKGERIDYAYVVLRHHVGDRVRLKIWRQGRPIDCCVRLLPPQYLVPEDRYDVRPTYFIYGGLLFVPLSRDYLKTWGSDWWNTAPGHLVSIYEHGIRSPQRLEVVVLQKVLADTANQGYHDLESVVISTVQGKPVRSLRDLVAVLENAHGEFVRLRTSDRREIVLDRSAAQERNPAILQRYGVPKDRSDDLLEPSSGPLPLHWPRLVKSDTRKAGGTRKAGDTREAGDTPREGVASSPPVGLGSSEAS